MKLDQEIEHTNHMWQHDVNGYRAKILGSRWGEYMAWQIKNNVKPDTHDISQDGLPGEIDFSTMVIGHVAPRLVGRMTAPVVSITTPEVQFPRMKQLGKSGKSARGGRTYDSSAPRFEYIKCNAEQYRNTADYADLAFFEDLQPSVAGFYWGELGMAHDRGVSSDLIKNITAFNPSGSDQKDPSGNTYNAPTSQAIGAASANTTLKGLITIQAKALAADWSPDTVLCSPGMMAKFLQDDGFISNDYYQRITNLGTNNPSVTSILGLDFLVSTQGMSDTKYYMYNRQNFAVHAFRRDRLITANEDRDALADSLMISSRYGTMYKDPTQMLVVSTN